MATFDHLPDSLHLKIFELIGQYELVLELKLVCRRWNRLVNDFGLSNRRLVLKRFPGTWGSFTTCKKKMKIIMKHFPNLRRLDFDNFYLPINIFDTPNEQIEYVTFTLSSVRPQDLLAFVRMCPNIKTLGIYYEFNLNDRCLIETLRMLKKLESFEIDAAFRFDLRGRFFTSFENLQKLYIDLGQPVIQTLMSQLVTRNGLTLKALAMKPVEFRHLKTIGSSFPNLIELRILRLQSKLHYTVGPFLQLLVHDEFVEGFRPPSEDSLDFSGLSKLTLLHINSWNQRDYEGLQDLVDNLLSASKHIKDLKLPFCPLNSRTLLENVTNLCPHLEAFTMVNPEITDDECSLFAAFTKLKHLTITGASHSVTLKGRDVILQSCPSLHPKRILFSHQRLADNTMITTNLYTDLRSTLPGRYLL